MQINASKEFKHVRKVLDSFVGSNPSFNRALSDSEFSIGPSSNSKYATPAHAQDAVYVGDSAHIRDLIITDPNLKALFKKDKDAVTFVPRYNSDSKGYDMLAVKKDGIMDSFLGGQAIAPWNVSWFKKIFKEVLLYSHADKHVVLESGTEPWAEVMSLNMAGYSGFAMLGTTGAPSNALSQDVNIQSGIMTSPIINMGVTYSLTLEEMEKAKRSASPFAGTLITEKQRYAKYVLDIMQDYLIYYGNAPTGTLGLLTVAGIDAWAGNNLKTIAAGASTSKGSDMYKAVLAALNAFLTRANNKLSKIRITMSPYAYNLLASYPYSDAYNPEATIKILMDNYMAGKTKEGGVPDIEIYPDPMLNPNTVFNEEDYDLLVISAPEIQAGASEEKQPLVLFGSPLQEFVYPVYPTAQSTSYKFLKRVAGVFAPVAEAIQVYSGFGTANGI